MARFRKKAISKMDIYELRAHLDELTAKRFTLDVQITEVLGAFKDLETSAIVDGKECANILDAAKKDFGLSPWQHQHSDLFV